MNSRVATLRYCWLLLLLCTGHAWADTVMSVRTAQWPGIVVHALQARLATTENADVHIQMHIGQLSIERLGWRKVAVDIDGQLGRQAAGRWHFIGQADCHGAPGGAWEHAQLSVLVENLANSLFAQLLQDQSRLTAALPLDRPAHWQLGLSHLPASWLRPGPDGANTALFDKGWLSGEVAVDLTPDGLRESGIFQAEDLSLNLAAIGFSGRNLTGTTQVNTRLDSHGRVLHARLQAELQHGSLSEQAWHADIHDGPALHIGFQADALAQTGVGLVVHWSDPGAMQFDATAELDPHARLRDLTIQHLVMDLTSAYPRYGHSLDGIRWAAGPWLLSGQLYADLSWHGGNWRALSMYFKDVDALSPLAPVNVRGLQGGINWRAHASLPVTTLGWRQLKLGEQWQPASVLQWQSREGQWRLLSPLTLEWLNGQLSLSHLSFQSQAGGLQWSAVSQLQNLHLEPLVRHFGFTGIAPSLTQAAVQMHGSGQELQVDTPLHINLWEGSVVASGLHLSQAGIDGGYELNSNFAFEHINLQSLASALDLGLLSGTAAGRMDGVQWSQGQGLQAFDFSLRSTGGGRIGQRGLWALATLTGASGSGSGVQNLMLHMFHTPSYQQLGLNARLQQGRLFLSGIDNEPHGYTLISGRSLPLTRFVGRDSQIPWSLAQRRWRMLQDNRSGPH